MIPSSARCNRSVPTRALFDYQLGSAMRKRRQESQKARPEPVDPRKAEPYRDPALSREVLSKEEA